METRNENCIDKDKGFLEPIAQLKENRLPKKRVGVLLIAYFAYLLIGGAIFSHLEVNENRADLTESIQKIIDRHNTSEYEKMPMVKVVEDVVLELKNSNSFDEFLKKDSSIGFLVNVEHK